MVEITTTVYASDRAAWRTWLEESYASATEIWLVYYKVHTDKPSVTYDEAVEEALCFGWIDGQVPDVLHQWFPKTDMWMTEDF